MTQAKYGNSSRLEGKNPTEDIMQRQHQQIRERIAALADFIIDCTDYTRL